MTKHKLFKFGKASKADFLASLTVAMAPMDETIRRGAREHPKAGKGDPLVGQAKNAKHLGSL